MPRQLPPRAEIRNIRLESFSRRCPLYARAGLAQTGCIMNDPAAISIRDLTKRYGAGKGGTDKDGEGKLALQGVSFDVPAGGIFGLLGPNGAGKSTLINIMSGMVMKTGGSVQIWGHDIDRDMRNAKASIGIVPQEIVFDPFFTPFEVLENQAGLWGVAKALRRSDELLRAVHLADKRDAYARSLSGGMKRRLLIAKAMVHSPPILVLDEPTAGVDVELRRLLWELVVDLNREGVTVVLTTHYLEEAEELCDRIAIINHGRLIANKPTRELVDMTREKVVVLTLDRAIAELPADPAFLRCQQRGERVIEITFDKDRVSTGQVLARIQQHGFLIEDVSTREADLEDVFVRLTSGAAG
jgi:ABC-2 type transport system ATP-binding protein